jgi:hypothetical protein
VEPAEGISFITEEYNGQLIYIYVNYDAKNCVSNALHVLKQVSSNRKVMKAGVVYEQRKVIQAATVE